MKFNFILLDWDGCIANTAELWLSVYKKIYKGYGLEPSDKEIVEKGIGKWGGGATAFGIPHVKEFENKLREEYKRQLHNLKLHEHVKKVMAILKKNGKKIAVVTTAEKTMVKPSLIKFNLSELIDVFLGREDVIRLKPDPEIVNKAIERMNGVKEESIIIGDNDKDVLAGKNAGIVTVVYYPVVNELVYTMEFIKNTKPDYLIKDFRELVAIVIGI